jgi:23S rRNA pseudoU1915 N3-methylase RlmH
LTPGSLNIALDERGEPWSSTDWSKNLQRWMFDFPRVNLIIGGPMVCRQNVSQPVSTGSRWEK